ncbi:thiamine pyrophosphate-dependent enzyme [Saccharopolyspora sp. TS4A08]|uniref:Thiamine pyrophosphate-dependent enzyme n=1 Tax=Saccharopolyspora ipomoeae TaxID=3042027 RepID=A0ABT6PI09_9PSEU|nr:thiamine pyrophosphate-dependent enzyme [Saccharopolyspora sp. TS4A08]MDI2027599.1 thiamine pyrophosphate-dependent enzyme [Saccharopolyspora sp. TS4A08]
MRRLEALQHLVELTENRPVVVTCAATSRELASIADRDNHLYLLDSMGLAGSVTTGLAMAVEEVLMKTSPPHGPRPQGWGLVGSDSFHENFAPPVEKVIGIEGDGSLLMNPNVLPTGGFTRPRALLVLLDNRAYGSTAGLPTYTGSIDLGAMAEAAGWAVGRADDPATLRAEFTRLLALPGPCFLHARIEPGNAADIPKLLADPVMLTHRFQRWLAAALGS